MPLSTQTRWVRPPARSGGTVGHMEPRGDAPTTGAVSGPQQESEGAASGPGRRRLRPGRILAIVSAVVVFAMWAWVLGYHLSGSWRDETPGRLANTTFPTLAEPICAAAAAEFAALPPAWATATPAERADVVDASVVLLGDMVTDLRAQPTGGEDAAVGEWLADWETFIADRADYASRLRTDPEARFYVTQSERDRRQITLAIDRFASTNRMPSCATPSDLS